MFHFPTSKTSPKTFKNCRKTKHNNNTKINTNTKHECYQFKKQNISKQNIPSYTPNTMSEL